MVVKTNAKTAKQAEPETDAAMVETISGAAEQAVTPPMPEGEAQSGAAPDDLTAGEEAALYAAEQIRDAATLLASFLGAVYAVVALALGDVGVTICDDGAERPATAEDLLAVTIKGHDVVVVTRDGRKHILKAGTNNESQ